jgi:hypothetical protein
MNFGPSILVRRGFSLMLVISTVAVTVLLGMALLGVASLELQATSNLAMRTRAQGLAESGVNLAIYYIQYPAAAPLLVNGYWPGSAGLTFGAGISGSATVTVVRDTVALDEYTITSTGSDNGMTNQIVTRVRVKSGLSITQAVSVGNLVSLEDDIVVTGNVVVDGRLTNKGTILGTARYRTITNQGTITTQLPLLSSDVVQTPAASSIQMYATYPWNDGKVYARKTWSSNTISSTTLGPTSDNPAGIYHYTGDLILKDGVTINGTLIVAGNLLLDGFGAKITPAGGYPALLVTGNLLTTSDKSMTVYGASWVAKSIKSNSSSSSSTTITFRGSLMMDGGTGTGYFSSAGDVFVIYDASRLNVPDLDSRYARGVTILTWQQ